MARKAVRKSSLKRKVATAKKTAPKKAAKRAAKTGPRKAATKKVSARNRSTKSSNRKPPRKKNSSQPKGVSHPGMMGDGTEEQNLNEAGKPEARITKSEVETAFKPDVN